MSKPGTIYRLTHQLFDPAIDDVQEVVDFSDNDNLIDDAADADIIDVIPAGNPVQSSVIDTSEEPFTVVKSQQLTCALHSDNPVNMNTFASGSDNRWSVHNYITINGGAQKTLFKGFLVLDDMSEPFMFDPKEIVLTANDGLGLLKEQEIVDLEGNNLKGYYKIAEIIAFCLNLTGTPLHIKAAFNIKLSGFIDDISIPNANDQHLFSTVWRNSKDFQNSDGSFMNCYEILQQILGPEAYIFQRQGAWWIVRVDEIEYTIPGMYISEFDEDGVFIGNLGEKNFDKNIGKDSPYTITLIREATKVLPTRPHKSVEITFPLDIPDYPENKDFEDGDIISDTPTVKTYEVANWPAFFSDTLTDEAPTTPIYIRRIFDTGYEKERYVVIEASTDFNFILSEPVPVGIRSKFFLNLERRLGSDVGGSGFYRDNSVQVRLYGNDGTFWTHKGVNSADPERAWVQCTATFRTNQNYFWIEGDKVNDTREAIGLYDGESAEIPVAGDIRIILGKSSNFGDTRDTYYSGLSFDYRPFINGSYGKYISQSQEVINTDTTHTYKAKKEFTVGMSDASDPAIRGAMFNPLLYVEVFSGSVIFVAGNSFKIAGYQLAKFREGQRINVQNTTSNNFQTRVTGVEYSIIGTETIIHVEATTVSETDATTLVQELTFELSSEFYNAAVFPSGPPSADFIHPYSEIQVFDVWNQFVYDRRVFQAVVQGLDMNTLDADSEADNCHLVHRYVIQDLTDDTIDRILFALTFDQAHRTGEWTTTLREVDNQTRTKTYLGRIFKFNA